MMQGSFYMDGEEIHAMDKQLEIKPGKIMGVDYGKGKDKTVLQCKGTVSIKPSTEWQEFIWIFAMENEKKLKNIMMFRAAWADKIKGSV